MMSNQSTTSPDARVNMGAIGSGQHPIAVTLEARYGGWVCLVDQGGCGDTGVHTDHVVALGLATLHNLQCPKNSSSFDEHSYLASPSRAQEIIGPRRTVTITGDQWKCTCRATGTSDRQLLHVHAGIHALLCGVDDRAPAIVEAILSGAPMLRRVLTDQSDERIEAIQAEKDATINELENDVERAEAAAAAADSERQDVIDHSNSLEGQLAEMTKAAERLAEDSGRNLARAIKAQTQIANSETEDLARQIAAIRADLPRADTKAQQQLGLTSFIGGAVIAIAGLTKVTVASLPAASIVLAIAAGVGVATVAGLTSAVMWPAKRGRTKGYSDSKVLKTRLEAERSVIQDIADRKFTLLRGNTIALAGTVLTSVAALVTALVGGA